MTTTDAAQAVLAGGPNPFGYHDYTLGGFHFSRDEYFAYLAWPTGRHVMSADAFLRALQRDVAWDFFYGIVNFDGVLGTVNHYGTVDLFAGRYNDAFRKAELDHVETIDTPVIRETFKAMLADWTNEGFDPFASPEETGSAFGLKHGNNDAAITRHRVTAQRMVSVPGDEPLRSDQNGHPVNRMFADVTQEEPEIEAAPGFEGQLASFNLYAYLSRSPVTWNPSVVSVCRESLYCPTTEEYILPIVHGNDRAEWFVQLSDEIIWDVEDRDTGAKRAKVVMKPGDVAAMPADIRHQGYAPKRSMLLVWENASEKIPALISTGQFPSQPVEF
jgi:Hydroquinone 1,2-dioxygenase large subunit N-terminal